MSSQVSPQAAVNVTGQLPPLQVGIYSEAGELVRTIDLNDPRTEFCAAWNEHVGDWLGEARPMEGGVQ